MVSPKCFLLLLLIGLIAIGSCFADHPHVVVVAGTQHYSADRSMPVFANGLKAFGFRTTLVMGEGDPEKKTENVLPGIDALDDADVAILYTRFLNLPDGEWKHVENYLKSGKPVIGLRTANHAFKFPDDHPRFDWNLGFGRRVLGTPYVAHQETKTHVSIVDKHRSHPVMTGIAKPTWESSGKLYLTRLEPGCVPLMTGEGEGRPRVLEREFGTIHVAASETDIVAWVWENEWGGKVFGTSLGHAHDFAEQSFVRMLVNAVCWSTDRQPPGAEEKIPTWEIEMAVPSKYMERRDR